MAVSVANDLVSALGGLVLERLADGRFAVAAALPDWAFELRRSGQEIDWTGPFDASDVFPFLGAFLPEAEDAWRGYGHSRADSGFWTEMDRDGREIHLEASALRVGDAFALVILRNERMFLKEHTLLQRARELRLTHDSLMREIESKDILVHAIVHDLAAPMHSIMGVLSLLAETALPDAARSWLEIAEKAADRQRELIADILDVFLATSEPAQRTRAEAGVDLREVLDRVLTERAPVARAREIRLEGPVEMARVRVVGDEARLFRVLTNLIDNALRYSPSGGRVDVSVRREPGAVLVFVEDEGPGVAPALLPRLFDRFARGSDERSRTGLGLFYCRITVEKWGGGIGYEPRAGGGARFSIRLATTAGGKEEGAHGEDHAAR